MEHNTYGSYSAHQIDRIRLGIRGRQAINGCQHSHFGKLNSGIHSQARFQEYVAGASEFLEIGIPHWATSDKRFKSWRTVVLSHYKSSCKSQTWKQNLENVYFIGIPAGLQQPLPLQVALNWESRRERIISIHLRDQLHTHCTNEHGHCGLFTPGFTGPGLLASGCVLQGL